MFNDVVMSTLVEAVGVADRRGAVYDILWDVGRE